MNKCMLIGRLTNDVNMMTSASGNSVGKFNLAVDRKNKEKETDFISCIAFGKTAEVLEKYVKKGHKVGIIGHIQTGSYTNKEGRKIYTTDIVVDEIEFLQGNSGEKKETSEDTFADVPADTALPF